MELLSIPFAIALIVTVLLWAPWQLAKVLYDGFKPLVRSALKNPRFSVRTMFGGTAIFAVAFSFLRMSGLFDHWHNSWQYYVAAIVVVAACLVLAIGLASALSLLVSEVANVFSPFKHFQEAETPDLHFLEQMPDPPPDRPPWSIAADNSQEFTAPAQNGLVETSETNSDAPAAGHDEK